MIKELKKFINYSIFSSLLFAMLGLLITIFPKTSLSLFSFFIAIMGIMFGIYLVVLNIISKDRLIPIDTFAVGILLFIFGILLIIYPNTLNLLISIVLGIWFILSGANKIKMSTLIRKIDHVSFIITLLGAILSIICGIVFIFNPLASSSIITVVSGIVMVVYAISNIIDAIVFKKHIKKLAKEMEKRISVIFED